MRRLFALAVVLLHGLLLMLLMSGVRPDVQGDTRVPVFASVWITMLEPAPPELPEPARIETPRTSPPRSRASAVEPAAEARADSTAISAPATTPAPAPQVDWGREASLAARRAAERSGDEQQKDFSPAPRTVPKPCVPRESSMEWNGEEDRRVIWAGLLPAFRVGKRCVVTLGFFACDLNEIPEANSHLLDDMRSPDRPRSSVPDPKVCD